MKTWFLTILSAVVLVGSVAMAEEPVSVDPQASHNNGAVSAPQGVQYPAASTQAQVDPSLRLMTMINSCLVERDTNRSSSSALD